MRFNPLVLLSILISAPLIADNVPFSQKPPTSFPVDKTPMFVCIGWDDNSYADGVNWFVDFSKNKKNPAGRNNAATFDNTTVKSTYFMTAGCATQEFLNAGSSQTVAAVVNSWKAAYAAGNEIANHSWNHPHGSGLTLDQWKTDQIKRASDFLATTLGMNASEIKGFRTPYLEYTGESTLAALKQLGFLYDCSVEFGFNGWIPIEGDPDYPPTVSNVWYNSMISPRTHKKLFWPFTLDAGAPPGNSAKGNVTQAGLWEFLVYTLLKTDTSGVLTGFDYNTWYVQSPAEWLACMKYNFDLRRTGNKAPLTLNCHTDYYSAYNSAVLPTASGGFTKSDWQGRRSAFEDLINYMLTYSDVRIITMKDLIAWMKAPVALDGSITVSTLPASGNSANGVNNPSFSVFRNQLSIISPVPGSSRGSIVSMNGKTVRRFVLAKTLVSVDVSHLPAGLYRVFFDQDQRSGITFMKQP